ncbi:hypothetical protein [Orrella marina]|uniref:hypothetical protein n=1 Tax=Orrella marina TaxID=2163011 RepID=UPI001D130FC3|nr:hypothetical protein [Orrella marina]
MWDFSLGGAFGLLLRTMPFIVLRILVYFGITLAYVLVTGIGAGIGFGVGALGSSGFQAGATFWGGAIGFGLVGAVAYWAREYILYLVKAGHTAVLVELMDGRALPPGKSQIAHGKEVVTARFAQASVLFGVDQLIKGVLRAVTRLVQGLLSMLPVQGVRQLGSILQAFLKVGVGFIDEVILAYCIRTGSNTPWSSSRQALVLYGQNYKIMLKNAAWLVVIVYLISFLVFVLMLGPAAYIIYLMPGGWSAGAFVFALLMAWSIKAAFLEPLAITCLMQVYFKAIEGQQPEPEWDAKLEQMSDKFRTLKQRALGEQQTPATDVASTAAQAQGPGSLP